MELIEYPDREMMMIRVADRIASDLKNVLTSEEAATLAVPGGTTPGPVFDTLAAIDLHWDRIRVMLTDERWVPETDARSNTRLVRQRLLTDKAARARFLPLYAEAETPEERIEELSAAIAQALPLSVLVLGMGADMHTASLFPGADRLADALDDDAPPLMVMRGGGAPEPRVTLTAPVLNSAMYTHIVIVGDEKREALDRARKSDPMVAPVAIVLRDAKVHWSA